MAERERNSLFTKTYTLLKNFISPWFSLLSWQNDYSSLPDEMQKWIIQYRPEERDYAYRCYTAKNKDEIFIVVDEHDKFFTDHNYNYVVIWNKLIGWGLPSKIVCQNILDAYKTHLRFFPNSKIIDFGAGTGIFAFMFNQMGISNDKILAIDIVKPTHSDKLQRNFWDICSKDNYKVDPHDILFISWGTDVEKAVNSYIARGGKCVIILGEEGYNMSFPSDYFEDEENEYTNDDNLNRDEWEVNLIHVPGGLSQYSEYLSINTKY